MKKKAWDEIRSMMDQYKKQTHDLTHRPGHPSKKGIRCIALQGENNAMYLVRVISSSFLGFAILLLSMYASWEEAVVFSSFCGDG